jgi:hypothetical protein
MWRLRAVGESSGQEVVYDKSYTDACDEFCFFVMFVVPSISSREDMEEEVARLTKYRRAS